MNGKARKHRIRSEGSRVNLAVALIENKVGKNYLRYLSMYLGAGTGSSEE